MHMGGTAQAYAYDKPRAAGSATRVPGYIDLWLISALHIAKG